MPWAPVDVVGGEVSTNEVDDWQISWLDHHLKDIDNGVLDHPVTVYLLGEGVRDVPLQAVAHFKPELSFFGRQYQ